MNGERLKIPRPFKREGFKTVFSDGRSEAGEILSEYADFIDNGTINYLISLISEKEKKDKKEILAELKISYKELYRPGTNTEAKKEIIKEAFRRLDAGEVISILYGRVKTVLVNFIIDVLSVTHDKVTNDDRLNGLVRRILNENIGILLNVRDVERRRVIEAVINEVGRFKEGTNSS
jgi:hypothetical protein